MSEPQFTRLDWGGIRTNDAGRQALVASTSVLAFLATDYADRTDDFLAISRVQEMVAAAIFREAEQRALDGDAAMTEINPPDGYTPVMVEYEIQAIGSTTPPGWTCVMQVKDRHHVSGRVLAADQKQARLVALESLGEGSEIISAVKA